MGEAPEPPGKRPAELDPAEIDHRPPLADRRQVPRVLVSESRRRGLAGEPRPDHFRDIGAFLLGGWRDAGDGPAVGPQDEGGVADGENLGTSRDGEVRLDLEPAGAIGRRVEPLRRRRRLHARRPDDCRRRQGLAAINDTLARAFRDRMAKLDLDPQRFERTLGVFRRLLPERGQRARPRFDQHDPRLSGVDVAEVGGKSGAREFGDRSGKLDPRRASADDDEGHESRALQLAGLALRPLEGEENAASDRCRVFERLQARRERLPVVMAEIGVPRAGRHHQRIEVDD